MGRGLTETANGAEELAEFARCIRDGGRPETGGQEGLAAVALVEAIALSTERGEPVEPAEVQ